MKRPSVVVLLDSIVAPGMRGRSCGICLGQVYDVGLTGAQVGSGDGDGATTLVVGVGAAAFFLLLHAVTSSSRQAPITSGAERRIRSG